jgi:alkylation response protein AidB-like acyl-CoA dehydrogenase
VPTDPFVAPHLEDAPRQEPNLAPGVRYPPAKGWRATRPGDLEAGQPTGALLGRPGPNVGYALTLAERARDKLALGPHESADDALAVVGEVAMKRAASFGRAPVMTDIDIACALLGYKGEVDPAFCAWRVRAFHGAHHEYDIRRAIVDAVPDGVLRMPPQVAPLLVEFRAQLRRSVEGG